MRFQVRVVAIASPVIVEAQEFGVNNTGGVTFFADRNRPHPGGGLNDQWGNPRMQRQRLAVAYFTNVESVVEIPEEDPFMPEVADEQGVPFNMGGTFAEPIRVITPDQAQVFYDDDDELPPVPVDEDGINWEEAQRDE